MSLAGKWLALRRKVAALGLFPAIALAVRTAWQAAFDRDEILYARTLAAGDRAAAGAGHRVRAIADAGALGDADVAALALYGGDGYLASIRERLRSGWRLFLVDVDGRLAGGGWVLTAEGPLATKIVPLVAGDLVILDCFTFPEQRGRGAYPALLDAIADAHRDAGLRRAFIFTRRSNEPSRRGIEKAGFAPVVVYQTLRLGAGELVYWKRRATRDDALSASRG